MVPACVDGVAHDVSYLWEDVLDEGFIAAERYPLSQLGGHTHYHTLTHAWCVPRVLLRTPALQLRLQRLQLEISGLLVQQRVVLHTHRHTDRWHNWYLRNDSPRNENSVFVYSCYSTSGHYELLYSKRCVLTVFQEKNNSMGLKQHDGYWQNVNFVVNYSFIFLNNLTITSIIMQCKI